jgi:ribose 5-phosphate isomerase RpiB
MANTRTSEATISVIRDLASAVKSGHVQGGVLFVPNAGKAVCYANRCPSLRAIVGTSERSVEQGIIDLGANVLIIEYTQHGKVSVDAMLECFLRQTPTVNTLIQRALAELHRLG